MMLLSPESHRNLGSFMARGGTIGKLSAFVMARLPSRLCI